MVERNGEPAGGGGGTEKRKMGMRNNEVISWVVLGNCVENIVIMVESIRIATVAPFHDSILPPICLQIIQLYCVCVEDLGRVPLQALK